MYDLLNREYGIQGRWPSPDPAGITSVEPRNPQSWNRYAYVLNNPLGFMDPTGEGCAVAGNNQNQNQNQNNNQNQSSTPQQVPQTGWCTSMENGGTTVMVVAGGVFVWGFIADGTGIGAPAGLFSQASAVVGGTLGAVVDGLGKLGKSAGVCQ